MVRSLREEKRNGSADTVELIYCDHRLGLELFNVDGFPVVDPIFSLHHHYGVRAICTRCGLPGPAVLGRAKGLPSGWTQRRAIAQWYTARLAEDEKTE